MLRKYLKWLTRIHTLRFLKIINVKSQHKGKTVIEYNKKTCEWERQREGSIRTQEDKRACLKINHSSSPLKPISFKSSGEYLPHCSLHFPEMPPCGTISAVTGIS